MVISNQQIDSPVLSANFSGQRVDYSQVSDAVPSDSAANAPEVHHDDNGEDGFDLVDTDDVQSMLQPTMSRAATRMTSPITSAIEKTAAMGANYPWDSLETTLQHQGIPESELVAQVWRPSPEYSPANEGLPFPWTAGPKEFVVNKNDAHGQNAHKPALSGVFGKNRHRRSSSGGAEALKKLAKALPSLSLSSSLLTNKSITSFGNSPGAPKRIGPPPSMVPPGHTMYPIDPSLIRPYSQVQPSMDLRMQPITDLTSLGDGTHSSRPARPEMTRVSSKTSRRSHGLRRSASDDSLLYHSISRVSSFGDDARFESVNKQVNSRFKAIVDSFPDMPSFKLPQVSSLFEPNQPEVVDPVASRGLPKLVTASPPKDSEPDLDKVLETLTGDLVVLGGYRGSILRSAKRPHRQLWVPVKVGLNIRQVDLEVPLGPEDEERMEESIYPAGMLKNIGPVDISRRLFKKLRECENARRGFLRVHDFGYDWRLSPHLATRKLISFLEALPSNKPGTPVKHQGALVLAHSLGGLITRHAVNKRPELFSGVVFAGSPQRCVNILGPFRNGDAVLLNEKVLTAQVNFSIRTSYAFLPEDGFCFVNKATGEEYPVDFYNVDEWIRYRFSPCVDGTLPAATAAPSVTSKLNTSLGAVLNSVVSRARSSSDLRNSDGASHHTHAKHKDRTIAPQMTSRGISPTGLKTEQPQDPSLQQARNIAYLHRTLAQTRQFRAELAHRRELADANMYPPLAVIYGKDTPTVYAASVSSRADIAGPHAYDDLVYRSGDGVVLAREAMLPPGYQLVNGGRVSTDRGHVTMLGDLEAVGKAIGAVVRGRRKGIGIGVEGLLY